MIFAVLSGEKTDKFGRGLWRRVRLSDGMEKALLLLGREGIGRKKDMIRLGPS